MIWKQEKQKETKENNDINIPFVKKYLNETINKQNQNIISMILTCWLSIRSNEEQNGQNTI